MDEYLNFAKRLAYAGGKLIIDNFGQTPDVEIKSDNSPVTWVDKQINSFIIGEIQKTYPTHGLMGEEADLGDGTEEFKWLCDPLDGTKCFILGLPQSVCMLALTKNGQVLLSVVYNPFIEKLYHAIKGGGAFSNGKQIRVSNHSLPGGYVLVETSAFPLVSSVEQAGGVIEPVAGTGFKCMMLAEGRCSAVLKGEADYHDVGPGSLVIEEAGGKVTGYDGLPLRYDKKITGGVILSNGVAHDSLVELAKVL